MNGVDLRGANLSGADLVAIDLLDADLRGAKLIDAWLFLADIRNAKLDGADFRNALIGLTAFGDTDLSTVKGLDSLRHKAPSTIGINTVYRSKGNISEVFLRQVGVPDNFIEYMVSLTGQAFSFYSCFISHSSKDKRFCQRLYADLQAQGVRAWYFPEDAKWGETVWGRLTVA